MNINETERDASNEDTSSTKVVSSPAGPSNIDISRQGDPKHIGESLGTLNVSPSSGKVPRPHLLIDVHLECVIVASNKDPINPDERHVAVISLK